MPDIAVNTLFEIDQVVSFDESIIVDNLIKYLEPNYVDKRKDIKARAEQIVNESRKSIGIIKSPIENLLQEYQLNSEEGTVLLCLAEALLRIPDQKTIDRLLEDKFTSTDWKKHTGFDKGLFVNASSWAFFLTGNILKRNKLDENKLEENYKSFIKKNSEPVFRTVVRKAVMVLAKQFVFKAKMDEAVKFTNSEKYKRNLFSFDMLGEGARTDEDAHKYYLEYLKSIEFTGKKLQNNLDPTLSNGVSVKLSALHPRYERHKFDQLKKELLPKLIELGLLAKKYNIQLCIDAEEDNRLILSLKIFELLINDERLKNWNGLGLALQAYQKRAFYIIDWLNNLANKNNKVIPVRLVKGAYWDSEIKYAQVSGFDDYSVFTRKPLTDLSWMACAIKLIKYQKNIFPAFATHNAYSIAFIEEIARGSKFEFQRIHGMADILHNYFNKNSNLEKSKCRIYAPVGDYEDLLPYLMRRLLENGANTSFVNKLNDKNFKVEEFVIDPIDIIKKYNEYGNPYIPKPKDIFLPIRKNSKGINLESENTILDIKKIFDKDKKQYLVSSIINGDEKTTSNEINIFSPFLKDEMIGKVTFANNLLVYEAIETANNYLKNWKLVSIEDKCKIIDKFVDLLEVNKNELIRICVEEAGKTIKDAIDDLREAIDFCYYYSNQSKKIFLEDEILIGPTGEKNILKYESKGVLFCISPWNFPIAIFTGQIIAALLTGNTVIAKPAEQTSIIAYKLIKILFEAGLPKEALQLVLGDGESIGDEVLKNKHIKGVLFTGSSETANKIQHNLNQRKEIISLTAETGGQNFMIVDSSALTEQVVDDVIESAFNSAGQRCSALRVLAIQDEVYDKTINMLIGATKKLKVGLPYLLDTDIGPLIDIEAKNRILKHLDRFKEKILFNSELDKNLDGFFIQPTIIEINDLKEIDEEVFGPILHIVRYSSDKIDNLVDEINNLNYGLTLGIHSRIDSTINFISNNVNVGNIYINRNITGAVVGSQPFGGRGLSGTGPKAGGPNYLLNLLNEKTLSNDITASGGNTSLLMLSDEND